jgi:asparagine synthase (glutamine-hydrolysing)
VCGFVGLFNRDGTPADPLLLGRMARRIAHRGPDEEGALVDGPAGFHHKRLAIIDLRSGRQPMSLGPVTVVYNGEIYNYLELREELRASGRVFATASDTEVLLHAYDAFGPDFIARLNGMFAFVLYDRARRRMIAGRDHFGIKPLYYWRDDRRLIFASEIKGLLAHPAVPAEPDADALAEYTVFQHVLNGDTLFRGIHKVRPGTYLLFDLDSGDAREVRYWDLDFAVDLHHTEQYFTDSLRGLLDDTIRLQLRSDVPVGTTLSGGLDSSLVTLLAARRYPGKLQTFTGAFREGPEFDETRYAAAVAREAGAEMDVVVPTEAEFIETLPKLVEHMDEPAAGPGLFPQYMVARNASRKVKVVLGGQGGDEIFGGYTRYVVAYFEQAIKGAIFETHDEGEHIVSLQSILPNLPFLRQYVPMLRYFWQDGLFEPMDRRYFRLIDRHRGDRTAFSGDFNRRFDEERIFGRFAEIFNHPNTGSYYNKMVHFDLTASLPALLHVEDRVTMAHGLESRVPLLDHRIAQLVASMPPRMKFRGAEMKYILKKAAKDVLPPLILHRKDKMGFPVPLHVWARNGLRGYCKDILLSKACRERGLFDSGEVERLIDHEDAYGRRLWGLLNLELWHERFIDGAPDWKKD